MGVDWRVPGSFAMVRSYARDGVTRAVSGGEPFRPLHPYRASGGRFDSAPGERTTGRTFLRANGPILLFFLYCSVSVLWSDYPEVAFKRWIRALGDIVMVLVILTDTATSLGCFLLGGGLIAVMNLPGVARKPAAVHLLVVGIVFLCLFGLFLDSDVGLVQAMGRDTTLTGRTAFWDKVLDMTVDPLFGARVESFWLGERLEKVWSIYIWHPNQAHNGYLEVFLNLGWTGVALFGLVMIWGYRNVVDALRSDPEAGRIRLA